jgi:hypothetical protein
MVRLFVCLSIVLLCMAGCAKNAPVSEREMATRVLAQELSKRLSPKNVLVISNPFSREAGRPEQVYEFEKAGINGLREGFGTGVQVAVDYPALKPEALRDPGSVQVDPQSSTPLSFLVADGAFSEVARKHPDADLIVTLIGLPVNLASFQEWNQPNGPKFALLLPDWRMVGGWDAISKAYQSGKLVAAVVRKPQAPAEETSGDSASDFAERYWLVTKENVENLMTEHPGVFGLRP